MSETNGKRSELVRQMHRGDRLVEMFVTAVESAGGDEDTALSRLFGGSCNLRDLGGFITGQERLAHFPSPSEFLCPERIPRGYEVYSDVAPTGHDIKNLRVVNCMTIDEGPCDGWAFKEKAMAIGSNYGLADADRWRKQGDSAFDSVSRSENIALTGTVLRRKKFDSFFIPVLCFMYTNDGGGNMGWMLRLKQVHDIACPVWSVMDGVLVK